MLKRHLNMVIRHKNGTPVCKGHNWWVVLLAKIHESCSIGTFSGHCDNLDGSLTLQRAEAESEQRMRSWRHWVRGERQRGAENIANIRHWKNFLLYCDWEDIPSEIDQRQIVKWRLPLRERGQISVGFGAGGSDSETERSREHLRLVEIRPGPLTVTSPLLPAGRWSSDHTDDQTSVNQSSRIFHSLPWKHQLVLLLKIY